MKFAGHYPLQVNHCKTALSRLGLFRDVSRTSWHNFTIPQRSARCYFRVFSGLLGLIVVFNNSKVVSISVVVCGRMTSCDRKKFWLWRSETLEKDIGHRYEEQGLNKHKIIKNGSKWLRVQHRWSGIFYPPLFCPVILIRHWKAIALLQGHARPSGSYHEIFVHPC